MSTTIGMSTLRASFPPSPPANPTVSAPIEWACLDPAQDVGAVARGRESDRNITRTTERLELAGKDDVERVVVRNCGDEPGVGHQRDRADSRAIPLEATDEFSGEMQRLGGTPAVPEPEDVAAVLDPFDDRRGGFGQRRPQLGETRHHRLVFANSLFEVHA